MSESEPRRTSGMLRRILGHWGLLASIVICLGIIGGIHITRCHHEKVVLSQLREADDGRQYVVSYSNPLKSGGPLMHESVFSGGPEWVTELLGVDPFKTAGAFCCIAPENSFSYSSTEDGQLLIDATYRSGVDDQDVELIRQFSNLRSLSLAANPISDSGVRQIANLSQLENLDLANTRITDEALKVIARLPRLNTLTIAHTHVSDAGIRKLIDTPTLEILDVTMTRVTSDGVRELEKQLPACMVVNR